MNANDYQFSPEAEDMHASASEAEALFVGSVEPYGSLDSRESAWAHAVLTGE